MSLRRLYLAGSACFALFALVCGYYGVTLPWGPRIDFDILGIMLLLGSAPRLAAIALTVVFSAVAVQCWVRAQLV